MFVAPGPLVTGLARHHGVALGGMACALFVADQDVADRGVDDRVVHRQDGAAGQAEHHVDPLHFEALDEGLGPCQLHVGPLFLSSLSSLCAWLVSLLPVVRLRQNCPGIETTPRNREVERRVACAGAPLRYDYQNRRTGEARAHSLIILPRVP